MLTLQQQLTTVADAYCNAIGVTLSVASDRSCGDSRRLPLLKHGSHSLTLRRADKALNWFSKNWPDGVEWPALVPRPNYGGATAGFAESGPVKRPLDALEAQHPASDEVTPEPVENQP